MRAQLLSVTPIILQGLVLGWSVAWPPGPVNAEIIRRSLSQGFWAAWWLNIGACLGEFLWAVTLSTGASLFAKDPTVKLVLGILSTILLIGLSVSLFRSAIRKKKLGMQDPAALIASESKTNNGFALGLILSLTSPWCVSFWLGVMGQNVQSGYTVWDSLIFAGAVMAGASLWAFLLCTSVCLVGTKFVRPSWYWNAEFITAALLLAFGAQSVWRLLA